MKSRDFTCGNTGKCLLLVIVYKNFLLLKELKNVGKGSVYKLIIICTNHIINEIKYFYVIQFSYSINKSTKLIHKCKETINNSYYSSKYLY